MLSIHIEQGVTLRIETKYQIMLLYMYNSGDHILRLHFVERNLLPVSVGAIIVPYENIMMI